MQEQLRNDVLVLTLCLFGTNALAQSTSTDPLTTPFADREIKTVPSFNSCSFYFRLSDDVPVHVIYKRTNETGWHRAHPTVCDQPAGIHKGSLFCLDEDTEYRIAVLHNPDDDYGHIVLAQTTFRTWRSNPPIAKTIDLSTIPSTASDGIVITEQGAPDGWIKYTAPADWVVRRTLRDNDRQEGAIVLTEAKYIILENLTVEGGHRHAILVDNCDFVRILNCDLSGWGRVGEQRFDEVERSGVYYDAAGRMINYDAGVYIRRV